MSEHRFHLIVNPRSGNGRAHRLLPGMLQLLADAGVAVRHTLTEGRMHAAELAARCVEDGQVPTAVGGDGTIHEVINGHDGSNVPAAVIPIGRGNDFARLMGLRSHRQGIEAMLAGRTRRLDVLRVHCRDADGGEAERICVNTLGIGFDAEVALGASRRTAGSGVLLYLVQVVHALRHYRATRCTWTADGRSTESSLFLAAIGNGTTGGGGFVLNPRAQPDDGLADLCLAIDMPLRRILRVLPATLRGGHLRFPEVSYHQSPAFHLTLDDPRAVHLDGEIVTENATEVRVEVLPRHIDIICR